MDGTVVHCYMKFLAECVIALYYDGSICGCPADNASGTLLCLNEHISFPPYHRLIVRMEYSMQTAVEPLCAVEYRLTPYLFHRCGSGMRPSRIFRDIDNMRPYLLHQCDACAKIFLGLAGMSYDDICSQCYVWDAGADEADSIPEIMRIVLAIHDAEHMVTAGLYRAMKESVDILALEYPHKLIFV